MGVKILLVEDNPANLQLMEYLLRSFGHTIVSANDGAEGVALAVRESPDVILMDLQMPKLNGYDAARQIKAIPALRTVPIVAVTAFAMVGDRDKILAHGFDGYIAKPIAPETFATQVERFVPKAAEAAAPAPSPAPEHARPEGENRHVILVVDNSTVNLSLAMSIFGPFGYEVVSAASVREALEIARRRPPDLILSDVHMPGQSGYDFLRIAKQDDTLKSIPFVFISSTVWGEAERVVGVNQGADAFILRPIEPQALVAEIARCIRVRRNPQDSDATQANGNDSHR